MKLAWRWSGIWCWLGKSRASLSYLSSPLCNCPSVYLAFFLQAVKLSFLSDSHLAPKFFKVVANSKRSPFSKTNKIFLYAVSVLDRPSKIKLGKRSLTCYKVDTRMDDIQRSGSSKSKMASSYRSRCMCYVLETNLTRKFAADLSLQIFLTYYISS